MRWRDAGPGGAPLAGLRVLDCSTLLPGPLATLLLADAGADVIKVERPGTGDEMRSYRPALGPTSANFALLNRGKRSVVLDLKSADGLAEFRRLLEGADVLVEQFRPGVMERLGLGPDILLAEHPRLVYCSITGYGRTGPKRGRAGHDLTYLAETGMLALTTDGTGAPVLPPALIADIAGGAYPAVMNILLALHRRERTGAGAYLDVAMTDNLFPLMYWALGQGFAARQWPRPGGELVTGGSPRYRVYPTADGGHLAAAPLEDRFWKAFCDAVGLPERWRDDTTDPAGTAAAVAALVATRTAEHWRRTFAEVDACASVVVDLEHAVTEPHVAARSLFARSVVTPTGERMPALPTPWAPGLADPETPATVPALPD
jgi:crotonobetainyl-CoA:carnitine CoA-transferase CaiB-like acyl-CoA transferase